MSCHDIRLRRRSAIAAAIVAVAALGACTGGGAKPVAAPPTSGATGVRQRQLNFDGVTRNYRVFSPSTPSAGIGVPLVMVLGGVGDSAQSMYNATQFDREAATGNFIVAYAQPAHPSWSAGFCCAGTNSNADNDVGYLNDLLDRLQHDYRIDPPGSTRPGSPPAP